MAGGRGRRIDAGVLWWKLTIGSANRLKTVGARLSLFFWALLFLAVAGLGAWATTVALRRGVFFTQGGVFTRSGVPISRRQNPYLFWYSIWIGIAASVVALCIGMLCAGVWIGDSLVK